MANYYTRTVITQPFLLTGDLVSVLKARGASLYPEGEGETVLDGIVNERPPLTSYSIVFDDGWTEPCEDVDEFLVDYCGWDDEDCEKASPEFRALVVKSEHEILREIIKVNPQKEEIVEQSSWGCSKMRLDGFGGTGLIVNRKGFLYITTHDFTVDADGTIKPGSEFVSWKEFDEAAAEHDADCLPQGA